MQPAICSVPGKSVRLVVALILGLLSACILLTPQIGRSQNVPPVTGVEIVGFCCPYCGALVNYLPGGKIPAICPHCKRSLVQQQKPTPQTKPRLQPIDPFGDFLFKDVPIIPVDGKLKTRHLDSNGLAVKAEEWSQEMKQIDAQSRQKLEAQTQEFERNKQDVIKSLDASRANSPAHQQLKNIFAGGENDWDHPTDDKSTKKTSERPFATLTDQELAQRAAENQKAIQTCMGIAKLDIKNDTYNQNSRLGMQEALTKGQIDMRNTSLDTFTSLGFMSGGAVLELNKHATWKSGLSVVDKAYAQYQDLPEVNQATTEGNWSKGGAAVGDIAISIAPETIAKDGFMAKASGWYTVGKGTIGLTSGLYSLYTYGNQNQQLDTLDNQRKESIRINGEKLKALEEGARLINAEYDQRAKVAP